MILDCFLEELVKLVENSENPNFVRSDFLGNNMFLNFAWMVFLKIFVRSNVSPDFAHTIF